MKYKIAVILTNRTNYSKLKLVLIELKKNVNTKICNFAYILNVR